MVTILLLLVLDTNECAETDRGGCEQGCTNTQGSFSCFCGNGYILSSDGKACSGVSFITHQFIGPINTKHNDWENMERIFQGSSQGIGNS